MKIHLATRSYSHADIQSWRTMPDVSHLSANERITLEFSYAWLTGQTEFELQTSGSTGAPKKILVTRQQMEASAQATAAAVGLRSGMQALAAMPIKFIGGRMMLVRGFVLDMDVTVVEPVSNPFVALPEDAHFDFASFTPMQMSAILEWARGKEHLDWFAVILVGGGAVNQELETKIQELTAAVYHTYAMTETVSHVALRRVNGAPRSERFTPLPGVQLGIDGRGCLTIRAALTNHELLITNDLVELAADGSFRWVGRWDNVINSGGVKVQVEMVEEEIRRLSDGRLVGRRFFVTGTQDVRLGEKVTLAVEGAAHTPDEREDLLQTLRGALQPFQAPRAILYFDQFLETPTGKIDRRATLDQLNNP